MALKRNASRLGLQLVALALALGLTGLLALFFPAGFVALDTRLADFGWRIAAVDRPEERLLIVDIDEKSLAALGPWPWPRARLAELAERIGAAGAAMQVWDLVLDAPHEDDAPLAAALVRHRAVLAAAFAFPGQGEPVEAGALVPAQNPAALPACPPAAPQAHGQRAPAAAFAAVPVGHINPRVDADGIVRALPAFVCRAGQPWPALPLAAWLYAAGGAHLRLAPGVGLLDAPWRLTADDLPDRLPLGAAGELYIPYANSPRAFAAVSAADLLAGRVPADRFAGRIVLVGSSAFGLADVVATPLSPAAAGVLVHAELLAGLMDGRLPYPPQAAFALRILAAVAFAGLLLALARRWPIAWALPVAGLLLALLLWAGQLALQRAGLLVGASAPAAAVLLSGLLLGALEHLRIGRERFRLFAHLASYLPAPVAERLLLTRPQDEVSAEIVEASVLVADLINFTPWSEKRPPDEVAQLLHRFFQEAVAIVEAHGGQVEALEGDAVLAVWNGLAPCADFAGRAFSAARALAERIAAILPDADPDGVPPPLRLGIGLDAGMLLVGSLGPRQRRQHLALGLPVTRAVRLAAMTGELGCPILIGPGLADRLPQTPRVKLIRQGEFLLEGLVCPCEVYAADFQ